MAKIIVTSSSRVTESELKLARLGPRFGRLDLTSQLALLAVDTLGVIFELLPRERIAICLAAKAGSLSTDVEFWKGRDAVGGPSPTLFAYTLPSAAIGEIAIRHRLTGPNLCFVGDSRDVLPEAVDLLQRGEADACLCIYCSVLSTAAARMIGSTPTANATAIFLQRTGVGLAVSGEFDRDMESLNAKFASIITT
jgi:3-oxoacyl-(acyl-carrier-protein) synthase